MIIFCLDEESEVMTKDGWKNWETLSLTDEVATINPETYKFEWQRPDDIHMGDYEGDMVQVNHSRAKMLVTPDHRMYGKFAKFGKKPEDRGDNRFLPAKDLSEYLFFYPRMANGGWDGELTNDKVTIKVKHTPVCFNNKKPARGLKN